MDLLLSQNVVDLYGDAVALISQLLRSTPSLWEILTPKLTVEHKKTT